uniref:Uncharacterized protein n=1 Tax=viral metagenome TaxID=1070528 RepID=A0A6C0E8M3_9ZZZZ
MFTNHLLEFTVLLYGLYLLYYRQYITYLILIVMSMVLVIKKINYKESLLFSMIFIIFVTQYHKYFPYRDTDKDRDDTLTSEGFKNKTKGLTLEEKKIIARAKKNRRSRKKIETNIKKHSSSINSLFPKRYVHNDKIISSPSQNMSDSWKKWARLKENFYIILNS